MMAHAPPPGMSLDQIEGWPNYALDDHGVVWGFRQRWFKVHTYENYDGQTVVRLRHDPDSLDCEVVTLAELRNLRKLS